MPQIPMSDYHNQSNEESDQPILSVRDLKTYFFQDEGVTKAVDGVSFDVYLGKTLGIVGESGCGKTVAAKSILRIVEKPGRIIKGKILLKPLNRGNNGNNSVLNEEYEAIDLTRLDPRGKKIRNIRGSDIAMVFQEPMTSFSPVHTVGNQLIEAIQLHQDLSKEDAKQRAIEALHNVEIPRAEGRLNEYPSQLSGGLRQRTMIAMALSCDPGILIADEPTTALDVTTQAQILDLLRKLQQEKRMSIILITHNMGVIAEMADDVVVMYLGRVVERGNVEEIFHSPKHPYTKALLKSIPSILVKPRVKLPTISGSIPHPYNRPKGCTFHPRCSEYMRGVCEKDEPLLKPIGDSQAVSCFLYHEQEVDKK
jgi:peptide/nickel transport system ATP-binding protein